MLALTIAMGFAAYRQCRYAAFDGWLRAFGHPG